ncbi:putative basic proline-rich protein-like [Iris pallida]|uniref:Basic proline-rich protein-like n=1 Tax=Iris pallida TaxID=29817 RepID=A0AAX6HRS3_IRIPA|nr:putative basic proline-rich protein-like [Iris pallida]
MDSNNNNNNNNIISSSMQTSTGAIDHFFPTSITTSPHFFDPTFLDTSLPFPTSTTISSWAHPPPEPTNSPNYPPPAPTAAKLSTTAPGPTGRPSKKRSRASRRAPTTVLTTDTSNFRAMVQEFTGIPAPPFASSSSASPLHFPRSLVNPPPSFLLKPFPHKFQPHFLPTSPPPPPLPLNNFQSLLQSQLLNMPQQQQQQAMAASSSSGELRLPDVIGSGGDQIRQHHHHHQQQQQQQDAAARCKLNFPGPMSTEFRAEKGSEGREGLMESWICSSD